MWTYRQSTGELLKDGSFIAQGYSGHGNGKNNPAAQSTHNVGPIPAGAWTVTGVPVDTSTHGPFVLRLEPCNGTQTFGRSGFLIHGDSRTNPGGASQGCIILPRFIRERVWASTDRALTVTT
jgi:Protein of unknown function (DUF2778)